MSHNAAIKAMLGADATLVALIGPRMFAVLAPQGTPAPYVTWATIDTEDEHAGGADRDTVGRRVQFTCYGSTFDVAEEVADSLHAAVSRVSGVYAGETVQGVFRESARDTYGESAELFARVVDYQFWFGTE